MVKVLIVDDDSIIRVKLRNLIDWDGMGCEIVAEASGGKEAVSYIERYRPSVVVTDMEMPGMNGVELIQYIRRYHGHIAVIALSAYDDFPYVRDSLRNGAIDYILKHQLTSAKMEAALRDAILRVGPEVQEAACDPALDEKMFLREILQPREGQGEAAAEGFYQKNSGLRDARLVMAVGAFVRPRLMEKMGGRQRRYVESIFEETLAFYEDKILFCLFADRPVFLFFMNPARDENYMIDFLNQQIENIDKFVSEKVRFALSRPFYDLHSAPYIFDAVCNKFFLGENIGNLPDISKEDGMAAGDSKPITLTLADEQWLGNNLRKKDMSVIAPFLHNKFKELEENHVGLSQLQFLAVDFINILNKQLQDDHCSEAEVYGIQNPFSILQDASNGVMLEKLLLQFYGLYCKAEYTEEQYTNQIINQAIKYIREHLSESFSLKEISSYLSVNSAYLSRLFKKNTGKTIVTYINEEKMKTAWELIESGALSLKEVALAAGFQNYNHFYLLFKETYGIPPSEVKKSK